MHGIRLLLGCYLALCHRLHDPAVIRVRVLSLPGRGRAALSAFGCVGALRKACTPSAIVAPTTIAAASTVSIATGLGWFDAKQFGHVREK